jgi:hypothetical protein
VFFFKKMKTNSYLPEISGMCLFSQYKSECSLSYCCITKLVTKILMLLVLSRINLSLILCLYFINLNPHAVLPEVHL